MAPTAAQIELDGVLGRLRLDLARKGHHALVLVQRILQQAGSGSSTLNYAEFEQGLARVGIFLPLPQLALLNRFFDNGAHLISIPAFMAALAGDLSPGRLHLVRALYDALPHDECGGVAVPDLMQRFHPEHHPKVLAQDKTASAIRIEITDLVRAFSEGNRISAEQFFDLFRYLGASIPLHDAAFADVLHQVFRASVANAATPPLDAGYVASVGQVLKEKIRQKTRGQESEALTLTRVFKHFDVDDSGRVSFSEWACALERFGILMPEGESRALFAEHDPKGSGHIHYAQFVHDLKVVQILYCLNRTGGMLSTMVDKIAAEAKDALLSERYEQAAILFSKALFHRPDGELGSAPSRSVS